MKKSAFVSIAVILLLIYNSLSSQIDMELMEAFQIILDLDRTKYGLKAFPLP